MWMCVQVHRWSGAVLRPDHGEKRRGSDAQCIPATRLSDRTPSISCRDPPSYSSSSCCLFVFLKKGETLHELCLLLSRSAAEFRPNSQPTEQITGRATKDASCAEHQREKSSKKTNNQQLRFHINPHRKQDNCVPPCRWLPSCPLTPLLYQQVAPVLVSSGVFFCFVF